MTTLPKGLRLSTVDSAKSDPFSSDDQIDDGLSSGSGAPLDALAFNSPFLQQLFGDMTLSGFGASDVLQLGKTDFADFQLLQGHMSQSGANTLITLDAHDVIKLTNVAASSLTASQFHFA